MNKHEPHATFLDGRYRLDRLVVAHDDVTIWDATDLARGLCVQLSVFERGTAVLHQGTIGNGMFVAIDAASSAPHLELTEDDFEREPRRRRAWPWAVAGLACALLASAGFYVASSRSHAMVVGETTLTEARLTAAPTIPPSPAPIIVNNPEPPQVIEAPVVQPPPQHRAKPAPLPPLQRHQQARPRAQQLVPSNGDPLTL